jgi:hypothetical protein
MMLSLEKPSLRVYPRRMSGSSPSLYFLQIKSKREKRHEQGPATRTLVWVGHTWEISYGHNMPWVLSHLGGINYWNLRLWETSK